MNKMSLGPIVWGIDEVYAVFQWGIVIGASLIAAIIDVRKRMLPNILTVPLFLSGVVFSLVMGGWSGFGLSLLTAVLISLPYLFFFILGHGGAGDFKMMAAVGAWLSLQQGFIVLAAVAIAGGVLALGRMMLLDDRRSVFRNLFVMLYAWLLVALHGRQYVSLIKNTDEPIASDRVTLPYGVAIFFGVCLGAIVLWLGWFDI